MYNPQEGLLALLPEIYKTNDKEQKENFLAGFLKATELLLLRHAPSRGDYSIREQIEKIHHLFYPLSELYGGSQEKPLVSVFSANSQELVAWLSSWFAYVPQYAVAEYTNRKTIAGLIRLYRIRGTVKGLEKAINLFLTEDAKVEIRDPEYPVKNPGIAPHTFELLIKWTNFDLARMQEQKVMIEKIVNREKPVHVSYTLEFVTPALRVQHQSRVGVDTFIGSSKNVQ